MGVCAAVFERFAPRNAEEPAIGVGVTKAKVILMMIGFVGGVWKSTGERGRA